MSIHSKNDEIILQFGLHKPAYRIVVNTPTTLGSIGLTTGLDPAMTLGCGGYGGNITSDNISPMHLLNIKRLAYEITPAPQRPVVDAPAASASALTPVGAGAAATGSTSAGSGGSRGLSAETLRTRIDSFLASRGFTPGGGAPAAAPKASVPAAASASVPAPPPAAPAPVPAALAPSPAPVEPPQTAAEFVCEDDVRQALKANRKIVLGERTIVTPSARDLGEQHHVFVTSLR